MRFFVRMDAGDGPHPIAREHEGVYERFNRKARKWERDDRTGSEVRFSGDWMNLPGNEAQAQMHMEIEGGEGG